MLITVFSFASIRFLALLLVVSFGVAKSLEIKVLGFPSGPDGARFVEAGASLRACLPRSEGQIGHCLFACSRSHEMRSLLELQFVKEEKLDSFPSPSFMGGLAAVYSEAMASSRPLFRSFAKLVNGRVRANHRLLSFSTAERASLAEPEAVRMMERCVRVGRSFRREGKIKRRKDLSRFGPHVFGSLSRRNHLSHRSQASDCKKNGMKQCDSAWYDTHIQYLLGLAIRICFSGYINSSKCVSLLEFNPDYQVFLRRVNIIGIAFKLRLHKD